MEYPGYGIYRGSPTGAKILDDANDILTYLQEHLRIDSKNIIVAGRSIGTGPATYVASRHQVGALILISAFKSVKLVAKHLFGRIGEYLVKEQFDNVSLISQVKCPTLLIHGKRDTIVPPEHAEALKSKTST